VKICHFKKESEICNYSFSDTILSVKLNRQVHKYGSIDLHNSFYVNEKLSSQLNDELSRFKCNFNGFSLLCLVSLICKTIETKRIHIKIYLLREVARVTMLLEYLFC